MWLIVVLMCLVFLLFLFFFLNDPPPTEISPLSLPAPLPISPRRPLLPARRDDRRRAARRAGDGGRRAVRGNPGHRPARGPPPRPMDHAARPRRSRGRSEEHTSELQSQSNLVCRLLLEKKKAY